MRKKILLPILVLTILGTGLFMSKSTFAEDSSQNSMASLVQKIADKFQLNKDEVQAVFDADKQERQQEMQTKYEEQLSQDIKDGKITEDQKQLIIAKRKELETNRQATMDSMKSMTDDERKTAMEKERTELESWAKEKGIDLKYLMGGFGMRGHGGPGGPGGPRPEGENTPPASPTATNQ